MMRNPPTSPFTAIALGSVLLLGAVAAPPRNALAGPTLPGDERELSPEEAKLVKKGLVRYRGQWMSVKDKDKREQGLLPYRKKWLPREQADELHASWENAWELEGLRFFVRTNASEELGSELLMALEAAYPHYKRFFAGREPAREKLKKPRRLGDIKVPAAVMPVFLFRDKAEYDEYCVQLDAPGMVTAPGFFDSASEIYITYVGEQERLSLVSLTLGTVSEMYTWYAWGDRMPEWFAEGARRYFDQIEWNVDTETVKVGLRYDALLVPLQKEGLQPMDKFLRSTIQSLGAGDRRWAWGGQAWALAHMMQSEKGVPFREKWGKLCEAYINVPSFTDLKSPIAMNDEGAKIFQRIFDPKDIEALEKALKEHIADVRAGDAGR